VRNFHRGTLRPADWCGPPGSTNELNAPSMRRIDDTEMRLLNRLII
jgi:hypothetical protein